MEDIKSITMNCKCLVAETSEPDVKFLIGFENKKWITQIQFQGKNRVPIIPDSTPIIIYNDRRDKKIISVLKDCGIEDEDFAKKLIRDAVNNLGDKAQELISLQSKDTPDEEEEYRPAIEVYGASIYTKANELIKSGKAQEFIVQKHQESCAGTSDKYSYAFTCQFASTRITSSVGGVHIKLGGPSGLGKSTLVNNFHNLTIPDTRVFTSMSGKNMYYDTDLHANMVVAIDEFENADFELIRTIKLATSKFQDKTNYKVVIDFDSIPKTIPERIAFTLLSVKPLDNAEMLSRFLTLDVPSDEAYKIEINEKQKRREQRLITTNNEPDFDTQVCRCIYHILNKDVYDIRIPFAPVIEWAGVDHTRNWEIFADIIRCVAFYNIPNREYFCKENDPETGVYLATYDDYIKAVEIYSKLADNNETKLSNDELNLIKVLIEARNKNIEDQLNKDIDREEFDKKLENHNLSDMYMDDITAFGVMDVINIAKETKMPDKKIAYMINGDKSKKIDGLTERIIGLHSEKCSYKATCKNGEQTRQKFMVWYDGPEDIMARGISVVSQDICDAETRKCKLNWIEAWKQEETKWTTY